MIDAAFAGTRRDENCTSHQVQLADESLYRQISDEEWFARKLRDPETDWRATQHLTVDSLGVPTFFHRC